LTSLSKYASGGNHEKNRCYGDKKIHRRPKRQSLKLIKHKIRPFLDFASTQMALSGAGN
jgi:hypothetical protein